MPIATAGVEFRLLFLYSNPSSSAGIAFHRLQKGYQYVESMANSRLGLQGFVPFDSRCYSVHQLVYQGWRIFYRCRAGGRINHCL